MTAAATALDERVLLVGPTRRDASTAASLLHGAGIAVTTCATFEAALRELARGGAALVVPEETITPTGNARLAAMLSGQPAWSDLPVLVLARAGVDSAASSSAMRTLGNVTLLERPLRVATLMSAVRTAMRARQRQYQIRGHLAERARAEESLRTADRRKDEFLATLGHELRNPLAPLLSGLHILRLQGTTDARARNVVDVMERQVTHLTGLVDDLLEISRITRGLVDVRHEPLDLIAVVGAAIDTSRPGIDAAGHHLAVDVPDGPIWVTGDSLRLTQVFANLLTNAAKYTNAPGQIEIGARAANGRVVVTVRDSGIGLAPSDLTSVFDMFMQVDRSNRRSQGGLGIGLTLVKSLVDMHGGRVEARSDGLGKGSEFVVDLPMQPEGPPLPSAAAATRGFHGRRILVVDDNRDAAETLGTLLEALGATVAVAHSGRAALERLDEFAADTMLLDIGMPDMNGYELARRVRQRAGHATTLLIALTGWGQDQDLRQSKAAGFDHHLVKPPDIARLRELLHGA